MPINRDLYKAPISASIDAVSASINGSVTSQYNTTIIPLTTGATYTGTGETNTYPDVMVSCQTDTICTLFFDFSVDGTNWGAFPPAGFNVSAGIHEFHTAVKGSRYFRVRLVNSGGDQSYLRLYTYFGTFRQGSAPIGFTIADDADAIVTKSVLSGIGDITVKVTDHAALQVTAPPEGKSAFGEAIIVQPTPIEQVSFSRGINPYQVASREHLTGTVSHENRMAKVSSGTDATSCASICSITPLKYNNGQGALVRFTAVFGTPQANSEQVAGIGDSSDGFFFGYNGTEFGILHRRYGSNELRKLQITTASSTAENVTVTLDGVAVSVPVTNSGNVTTTANEIASYDYSDIGDGWLATAYGDTITFRSWKSKSTYTGTYSIAGTTVAGTFTRTVIGADPTDTWIPQTSWNGDDKFDGNGLTGVTLDTSKGNVFQVKYQWLGFGAIFFYIEDPDDGEMHLVHMISWANQNTTTTVYDPTFIFHAASMNKGNTTNIDLYSASFGLFIEGIDAPLGIRMGVRSTKTDVTTALRPLLSIRVNDHFNGFINRSIAKILRAAMAVNHNKPVTMVFIANATLTNASWSDIISGATAIQYDTSADAVSGGTELYSVPLGITGQAQEDVSHDPYGAVLVPGQTLTVAAIANSGTAAEANIAFNILERI